ncbi:MAG: phosphoribosyl-ATP diphosphatase [Methyloceanibacter sp.]|uniref:phosphoribosyl-ATP diphosphatase n=1 Tax=Methyloceanibacter sp. TaxID=1965321 RepID=UPI001DC5D5D4|nr:phosphoribosyl-ATP diphosphatase [Methyloceanibacter sp.]MCB1443683.1 phosphoribosyl-ATP diphosphatase [Methyloceanibacter sp.]
MSKDALDRLAATIRARRTAASDTSYTRQLLDDPIKSAKKVGEEGVEVAIAATAQDRHALISESADLLYHFLVLLESRDVGFDEVCEALEQRMGTSGLARQKGPAD